jgi:hypothetical protein
MRPLRDDTHLILDGEVRVYPRERSRHSTSGGARRWDVSQRPLRSTHITQP